MEGNNLTLKSGKAVNNQRNNGINYLTAVTQIIIGYAISRDISIY